MLQAAFKQAFETNDVSGAIEAINKQIEKIPSSKSYVVNLSIQTCMQQLRIDFVRKLLDVYYDVSPLEVIESILDSYQEKQLFHTDGENTVNYSIAKLSNDLDSAVMMQMPPHVSAALPVIRQILQLKISRQLYAQKYRYSQAEAATHEIDKLKVRINYPHVKPYVSGFIYKKLPGYALVHVRDLFIYRRLKSLRGVSRKELKLRDIQNVFDVAQAFCSNIKSCAEVAL